MDRENVVRELYAARLILEMGSKRDGGVVGHLGCVSSMKYIGDAIELLEGQEPKNALEIKLSKDGFIFGGCPRCKELITRADHKKYCGFCGQAVKWE